MAAYLKKSNIFIAELFLGFKIRLWVRGQHSQCLNKAFILKITPERGNNRLKALDASIDRWFILKRFALRSFRQASW